MTEMDNLGYKSSYDKIVRAEAEILFGTGAVFNVHFILELYLMLISTEE